ncbi:hypothetical protein Fleli_1495 [Bernardetia litoralis DSM 6794]|uniref:Uncharacterized protein n=1 Tax=Bernardetia litoralis (strain ATCC 23117 / DSM 6794 / NBRC 15988 / NCIMB 1366 / Fx l1 / Sio-4) TaxID=880071 RepID=I4AIY3_BERLS|nr:hypothetical protein [Bernardetia litoralis]AFM03918.1 hypothetical protein Fleli_1495 [Bernardetia litoralis DSM 6794]
MNKTFLTKLKNELNDDYAHYYQLKEYPHILIQEWKGFCMPKELKEGHQKVIDLVTKHQFTHLISVIVELEGAFEEVNEWFLKDFNPKMVDLGMEYEAIIQSKNLFSQLSAEDLVEDSTLKEIGYHMRLFDSIENALEWFEEER